MKVHSIGELPSIERGGITCRDNYTPAVVAKKIIILFKILIV